VLAGVVGSTLQFYGHIIPSGSLEDIVACQWVLHWVVTLGCSVGALPLGINIIHVYILHYYVEISDSYAYFGKFSHTWLVFCQI